MASPQIHRTKTWTPVFVSKLMSLIIFDQEKRLVLSGIHLVSLPDLQAGAGVSRCDF